MTRAEKEQAVAIWKARLEEAQLLILTDFQGLNVVQLNDFRRKLRQINAHYEVGKNNLLSLAAQRVGQEGLKPYLVGPTAALYTTEEPVAAAKAVRSFIRENPKLKLKAGLIGGKVINSGQVLQLASLPSREVLLGRLMGQLMSPVAGFIAVLCGTHRKLLGVLEAIKQKKEDRA